MQKHYYIQHICRQRKLLLFMLHHIYINCLHIVQYCLRSTIVRTEITKIFSIIFPILHSKTVQSIIDFLFHFIIFFRFITDCGKKATFPIYFCDNGCFDKKIFPLKLNPFFEIIFLKISKLKS